MPTDVPRRKFRALLTEEAQREYKRYTDICLVVENPDGSNLYVAGGQWDAEVERYTGQEPDTCKTVRLESSEVEAGQWICWWLQERLEGRPRDFVSLQLMGERAAGKTWTAALWMVLSTLESPKFGIPGSIGWAVSKSFEERDEVDRELRGIAPSQWYRYQEERRRYTFPTGGTITSISADDPENLKRGRVDWLLLNEIQKLGKRAYLNGLARLKDKAGCSLITGNWPTAKSGDWLYELDEKRRDALRQELPYPVRLVKFTASGNKTLDVDTGTQVDRIIRDLDPKLAATDLDGLQMPVTDRAYWEWDKIRNARRPPDSQPDNIVRNVTREVTAHRTMRRAGYDYLIGVDFQKHGGMVAVVHKLFGLPDSPVMWAVDELLVQGTEEDLIAEMASPDCLYTPENSLVIGDGSGRWQDGEHRTGRTSFQVFRDHRYNITGPVPQKDSEHRPKNVKFDDRCRLANWAIKHSLYMVDPKGSPTTADGFAKCEIRPGFYGQGRPAGEFRHITDAGTYALMWLYGEKIRKIPKGGSKRLYESITSLQANKYRVTS